MQIGSEKEGFSLDCFVPNDFDDRIKGMENPEAYKKEVASGTIVNARMDKNEIADDFDRFFNRVH